MTEAARKLRDKAVHTRDMARSLTDAHARAVLEALATEFEQQAADLERQERDKGRAQDHPASRNDTP